MTIISQAQAHARKCHSQLLAGTSDDTSYVAKFESELAGFNQTCSRIRKSSEPTDNYQENAQLVEKWAREQGIDLVCLRHLLRKKTF